MMRNVLSYWHVAAGHYRHTVDCVTAIPQQSHMANEYFKMLTLPSTLSMGLSLVVLATMVLYQCSTVPQNAGHVTPSTVTFWI
jgi:hypothetical protein